MLELFYITSKDVTYNIVNGTQNHLLNRNAFLSDYSVLSAEGFRFLILPVQITPFPLERGGESAEERDTLPTDWGVETCDISD